jgi:HNH endonuclease
MPATTPETFWEKVNRNGPVIRSDLGPCWLWTGSMVRSGYGRVSIGNKSVRAHRVAWALANETTMPDQWVLHRCDNPPCVRPDHLFLGDVRDNVRDMISKGRAANLKGEAHGMARLDIIDVLNIRLEYESGEFNQHQLAQKYGVTQTAISQIVLRKKWRHIA